MSFDEKELFEGVEAADRDHPFQEGTVGWGGSPEIAELGTESGDGMTFVRVTLFVGAPVGKPQSDDKLANGRRILARCMGPLFRVPKRGARVLVIFPGGDWKTPGNAVILGEVGATPDKRFGRKKTVMDFGADDVVLVSSGSISLVCEVDKGDGTKARHVVSVSGPGGAQVVSDGSGLFAKAGEVNVKAVDSDGNLKTALVLGQDEASLVENADASTATLTLTGGNITSMGQYITIGAMTGIRLGSAATPATPVLIGPTPPGVPSTLIFGQ